MDKCCTRCIVKSYLLTLFIELKSIFNVFSFELVHKIIFQSMWNFVIIYPYRGLLKLSWYSKGLNFSNGISIFHFKFAYIRFEDFRYYWHAKYTKDILKQIYTTYSIYGVLALYHQCECVSTKITFITEERLSRNQRIVTLKV